MECHSERTSGPDRASQFLSSGVTRMRTGDVLEQMNATLRFSRLKVLTFKQEGVDARERTVEGYASTPTRDLQDEIVLPEAFRQDLADYMRIPAVTWMHDWGLVPPGHTERAEVRPEGLFVRIRINDTELGKDIWKAIESGSLRALSIGFDGEYTPEWGYFDERQQAWVWQRVALREIAIVSFPANRRATFNLAKTLGLPGPRTFEAADMAALPGLPLAPEDHEWDRDGSEKRVREWAREPRTDAISGASTRSASSGVTRTVGTLWEPTSYRSPMSSTES